MFVWWIASLNDKDSIHFENSMQWVMRTSSKDCRCIVYNCTGVNWCELCPTRDIKRTKQKRTVNGHVEPVCPLHQPPREKHLEKCSFICIVYEDARMAKDREFCRFIIRLRHCDNIQDIVAKMVYFLFIIRIQKCIIVVFSIISIYLTTFIFLLEKKKKKK
eukprot:832935_1